MTEILPHLECTQEAILDAAVRYARLHINEIAPFDFARPDHVYDRCGIVSGLLDLYQNVEIWFLRGDPEMFPRSQWTNCVSVPHYVAVVDDALLLDLTHRQIDSAGPIHWVGPKEEYLANWLICTNLKRNVYIYKPRPIIPDDVRYTAHVLAYYRHTAIAKAQLREAEAARKRGKPMPKVTHLRSAKQRRKTRR